MQQGYCHLRALATPCLTNGCTDELSAGGWEPYTITVYKHNIYNYIQGGDEKRQCRDNITASTAVPRPLPAAILLKAWPEVAWDQDYHNSCMFG